jgi:hypothetical protein
VLGSEEVETASRCGGRRRASRAHADVALRRHGVHPSFLGSLLRCSRKSGQAWPRSWDPRDPQHRRLPCCSGQTVKPMVKGFEEKCDGPEANRPTWVGSTAGRRSAGITLQPHLSWLSSAGRLKGFTALWMQRRHPLASTKLAKASRRRPASPAGRQEREQRAGTEAEDGGRGKQRSGNKSQRNRGTGRQRRQWWTQKAGAECTTGPGGARPQAGWQPVDTGCVAAPRPATRGSEQDMRGAMRVL